MKSKLNQVTYEETRFGIEIMDLDLSSNIDNKARFLIRKELQTFNFAIKMTANLVQLEIYYHKQTCLKYDFVSVFVTAIE